MFVVPICESHIQGAVSFERRGDALIPWRLPYREIGLYPPDGTVGLHAQSPAGMRIQFRTNATALRLALTPHQEDRPFDLVCENQLLAAEVLPANSNIVQFQLPTSEPSRVYEIWLPHNQNVELLRIECQDGRHLLPAADTRLRWITYGSSISQCAAAHSPARTWPATTARELDLNLTCLGFRGNCHLEPMVAVAMREVPADLITLKVGINIMAASSLSPRTFSAALIGFIRILRDKHPFTPIGVVSSIVSPSREKSVNAVGIDLATSRTMVADSVTRLAATGDKNIWYFDGAAIFNEDMANEYLPDGLHPNGDGYELLGKRMTELVMKPLLERMG